MKKFLCLLMAMIFVLSLTVNVFAEQVKIESEWAKYLGKVEVTKTEENGETVYAFKNFTAAFTSPGIDIMPILKEIIKGKDSVTLNFSMDIKAIAEEDFTFGMLIRTEDVHPKVQKKVDFKEIYKGEAVKIIDDKNYLIRIASGLEVSDDWETVEGEITLTPDDILTGMWKRMVLCFDGIEKYEIIDTIFVKNPSIEIADYEEGEGKPSFDIEKLNVEKPTVELDNTDTPALPEGNKLTDNAWYKGKLGNVQPVENAGEGISAFSNIGNSFASPVINIYPTIKELLKDKDEVTVWIVFDVRAALTENNRIFGIKIRPNISNDYVNDKSLFLSKYSGSAFTFSAYGIMTSPYGEGKFTNKWQRIEISKTFTKDDINDELWTEWNLCFDMMTDYYQIKEIQIKNTAIYLENEYESITGVVSDETGKTDENDKPNTNENVQLPASSTEIPVIYRPYGFNKYTATFADVVDQDNPPDENGGNPYIAIGCVAGAVIIVVAAAAIVIIKKKKGTKGEEK